MKPKFTKSSAEVILSTLSAPRSDLAAEVRADVWAFSHQPWTEKEAYEFLRHLHEERKHLLGRRTAGLADVGHFYLDPAEDPRR